MPAADHPVPVERRRARRSAVAGDGSRSAPASSSKVQKVFQGRPSSISARQPISWKRRIWASSCDVESARVCHAAGT